jgi:hypothetical protein
MTFAHPYALFWGLIALPIIVLYLLTPRWRRREMTTGVLWEQVFAEQPARARWLPLRPALSVTVQLGILALIVLALAEPQFPPPRHVVLVIDNPARMNAADVKPSRLSAAKEAAGRLIEGLRDYDRMAVLSAGRTPTVRCPWTGDQAQLQESLQSITAEGASSQLAATVALARRMTADYLDAKIVILSDACCNAAAELAGRPGIDWLRVGKPVGHAAVTRLAARRSLADPTGCDVLIEAQNFSDQPLAGRLLTALDGNPLETIPLNLPPNGRWQQAVSVNSARAGRFTARIEPADAWPADNEAAVKLPPAGARDASMPVEWQTAEAAQRVHDLRVCGSVGSDAGEIAASRPLPPWRFLAAAAALLLCALEWCLYQRRWIS